MNDHELAVSVLFHVRAFLAEGRFHGIGNVDLIVSPGYATDEGMQYKLCLHLRQGGHRQDHMLVRMFVPTGGWPVFIKDGAVCHNARQLEDALKATLSTKTMEVRLRGLVLIARHSLAPNQDTEADPRTTKALQQE